MAKMRYVFPFWYDGLLEGFVALSSDVTSASGGGKFSALEIFAQFIAFELRKFTK
jgi:hypothetical protein